MKNLFIPILIASLAVIEAIAPVRAQGGEGAYEAYYNYFSTAPDDAQTNYAGAVQGITHDNGNWFISQTHGLWKIPVGLHLAGNIQCGQSGVVCRGLSSAPQLSGYNHIGDIDYYQYNSTTGFLLLPLEDYPDKAVPAVIAVFNPVNLQYIAHAELPKPPGLPQPKNAPWVAVNPANGLVHTNYAETPGIVFKFSLNWDTLAPGNMSLQYDGKFDLLDEDGVRLDVGPQGGVFSESGNLFYINNGYLKTYNSHKDGISVFDMQTKQRIAHSTMAAGETFWYGYATGFPDYEEPEGLTIWDLDEHPGAAQGMSGQLHVLLLNNRSDNVYIRHYTNKTYVDSAYSGEELGDPTKPFNTVGKALGMAWNGSRISIKAGNYPESLTFSKRLQLLATGGTVTIGTAGRISLTTAATINIYTDGALKIY